MPTASLDAPASLAAVGGSVGDVVVFPDNLLIPNDGLSDDIDYNSPVSPYTSNARVVMRPSPEEATSRIVLRLSVRLPHSRLSLKYGRS